MRADGAESAGCGLFLQSNSDKTVQNVTSMWEGLVKLNSEERKRGSEEARKCGKEQKAEKEMEKGTEETEIANCTLCEKSEMHDKAEGTYSRGSFPNI